MALICDFHTLLLVLSMRPQKIIPLFHLVGAAASRPLSLLFFLLISAAFAPIRAQDNIEIFCEGENLCVPDSLVFRWDENNESVLVVGDDAEGDLAATVFLDTRSNGVTSWSFGLRHDPEVLTLLDTSCTDDQLRFICGTDAAEQLVEPFYLYSQVVGPDQGSEAGFISAVVLSFVAPAHLPADRLNSLAKLTYRPGEIPSEGTMVRFSEGELRPLPESPAVGIQIEVGFDSGGPATLEHGKLEIPFTSFVRGDVNDSGLLEVTDAINLLNWMFLGGLTPTCMDAADADDNGQLGLSDGINILIFLFGGGAAPADPGVLGGGCERDPDGEDDGLLCEVYTSC